MTSIGLLFAGSVLLINGVSLLGCCDATEAAPVNAFVGILLVAVVASICIPVSDLTPRTMFSAVGFLLFAFTYLGVAINSWTGGTGTALGWYCLWAVVASLVLAGVNFARYDDPRFGMLWLLWAVLFTLFFLVLALGITRLESATGWAASARNTFRRSLSRESGRDAPPPPLGDLRDRAVPGRDLPLCSRGCVESPFVALMSDSSQGADNRGLPSMSSGGETARRAQAAWMVERAQGNEEVT
jgi:AmiS/UreI family transporter